MTKIEIIQTIIIVVILIRLTLIEARLHDIYEFVSSIMDYVECEVDKESTNE